jgi:RHS repeat-associated protein
LCQNSGLAVASQAKTDYLYTGKELQQFFGIDWYDSFARFQTTSGVFTSPDPLAEKYYSLSPYAYCAGDPVNKFEPDGKKSYLIIWASDSHHYGHAAFAVDNYKCDSKNGTMAPDGTVTCYSLFPINSYTKKQAIKDEKVRGLFLVSQNVTLEAIKNKGHENYC